MGEHSSGASCPANIKRIELMDLPDSILLEVFFYLPAPDLACLAQCCSRFHCVTRDDLLWKRVFCQRFKIPLSVPQRPGAVSWLAEYHRLREETPAELYEELTKHRDQVLHVSFSHNGEMFSTCSKDAKILVWNSDSPSTLRFSANMTEQFNWRYSQFSQFNRTDTLLLVSGVFHGSMTTSGEIAVFDLNEFQVQCRVTNKPYDVFGCWYNNQHLFSGSLYWTGHLQSISALWLNKASQEVESEKESVMMNLYRFSNVNASSIRTVMVANVPVLDINSQPSPHPQNHSAQDLAMDTDEEGEEMNLVVYENGDVANHPDSNNSCVNVPLVDCICEKDTVEEGAACVVRSDICDWMSSEAVCDARGRMESGHSATVVSTQGCREAAALCGHREAVTEGSSLGQDSMDGAVASKSLMTNGLCGNGGNVHMCVRGNNRFTREGLKRNKAERCVFRMDRLTRDGFKYNRFSNHGVQTDLSSSKACHPFSYCCSESGNSDSQSIAPERLQQNMSDVLQETLGFTCEDSDSSCSFSPNAQSLSLSSDNDTTPTHSPSTSTHPPSSPPHRHSSDIPRLSCCHQHHHPHSSHRTEKVLIFTMGKETYTPHLIGFKRILLKDIVGEEEAQRRERKIQERELEEGEEEEEEGGVLLPSVEHNHQGISQPPTQVDHTINLKGHIVGMALSPDHRYLYVNSRQWPENYHIESALEPPPIAQEIDIHVIDLLTMTEVGKVMTSHKAFTPNDECFFLFLDVSPLYVASGAEDRRGYLWDRHYGVHLHCFPHSDVVNSVAFNPRDQEMLVSVSDDNTIRVWRSRRQMRRLHRSANDTQSSQ